jgi:hypothetical protein
MQNTFRMFLSLLVLVFFTAACGGNETQTPVETSIPAATQTPNPCIEPNVSAEVDKVHKHMREFDDYSALASNTPQAQLVMVVPELQRVLREAEDQAVPACLNDLKRLQVSHMRTVVQTLLAFIGSTDAAVINSGIAQARDLHTQYDIERASLLGITLTVSTAAPTSPPLQPSVTPTPMVTNSGTNELNLRNAPDFNAPAISVLPVAAATVALGRTADSQWILVQAPDQPNKSVWVYATVVQLSAPIESLPVVTP